MDEKDKDYRTFQFLIKKDNPLCSYFLELMKKSNNLYNATNFHIRQTYTALKKDGELHELQKEVINNLEQCIPVINAHLEAKHARLVEQDKAKGIDKERKLKLYTMPKSYVGYQLLDAYFKHSDNLDYNSLPGQVNQQVMKQVYNDWKSFFEACKQYKVSKSGFTGRPKPPRYKNKGGYNQVVFSNQICTVKDDKYLRFPKTNLKFNLSKHLKLNMKHSALQQIRVQKYYDSVKMEIVLDCSKTVKPLKAEINNCMAIDLGVNNIATCVFSNGVNPVIINGKPIKSMNQHYNKLRAKLNSDLRINKSPKEGPFTSKRLEYIDKKRHLKFKDFLHKVSRQVVNLAIENNIDKVIIGYNKQWKVDVNIAKDDKQSFIQIPFLTLIQQIEYKLKYEGIHFELKEESYTSKSSFLDNDTIPTYGNEVDEAIRFSGKRIKRGLYKSKNNIIINADVNGAANILRKHFEGAINLNHKILSNVTKMNIKTAKKKRKQETCNAFGIVGRSANCVA